MQPKNDTNCPQIRENSSDNLSSDLPPTHRKYNKNRGRQKRKYRTRISQIITEIIDNPSFPKKRIENAYPDLTDAEVEEKYVHFAKKWAEIRHNKKNNKKSVPPELAKGLTLDDFANLTSDFLGSKGVNRDVVNRVLHTGDDNVRVRSRKVNENTIKTVSYFTENYTFNELLDMAAEAIADSKKAESTYESCEISLIQKKGDEKLSENITELRLQDVVDKYIKEYGYKHLLTEVMKISGYKDETKAKALVFDLLIGSQPPIAIIVVLSQMLQISAEEMIDIVRKSFIF
jgi:hypothetical protein